MKVLMPYKLNHIKLIFFLIFALNISTQQAFAFTQNEKEEKVFEDDFKSRYSNRKYNYEGKKVIRNATNNTDGEFSKYKNTEDPRVEEESNSDELTFSNNLSWLFILILIVAVLYLATTLLNEGNTGWFSTKRNVSLTDHQSFNLETANPEDFISLIKSAEDDNNFRLAIRYYFLFILKTMSLKNIIKIEEDKTNTEYLREVNNKKIEKDFSKALYLYNYTWYGEFDVNKLQYKTAKSNFKSFLNKLKK